MCKYCGADCVGIICTKCIEERTSILLTDPDCEILTAWQSICGVLRLVCIIFCFYFGWKILVQNSELLSYHLIAITSCILSSFFKKLKIMLNRQADITADIEMTKRHK